MCKTISRLYSVVKIHVYITLLISYTVFFIRVLQYILKPVNIIPSTLFFFKVISAILVTLSFHINFRITLRISINKASQDLNWYCVKSISLFNDIFTILSLPIHENNISHHLINTFISFISDLQISAHRSLHVLDIDILNTYLLTSISEAIVKGIFQHC